MLGFVALSFLMVLPLRWFNPLTTAFMLQDASAHQPQYECVDWQDISLAAKLAVVASEDQRFADHFGFDFTAIQKAVDEKHARGYLRGASTISQQTTKNLFLWPSRNFVRKGLEAWLTLVVELCLPKRRILEIYLNVAEFGPGIYGVNAASRQFFGTSAARLRDSEAVLPSTRRLHVNKPSSYVRERQHRILAQVARLRREGWITSI